MYYKQNNEKYPSSFFRFMAFLVCVIVFNFYMFEKFLWFSHFELGTVAVEFSEYARSGLSSPFRYRNQKLMRSFISTCSPSSKR